MAKMKYAISTRAPKNHADRPLFVARQAVMQAISIMTTAPGQKWRSIGDGPSM